MQLVSLVWGVLVFLGMLIAFLPHLGVLNWLNTPVAGVGLILSLLALAMSKAGNKAVAIAALVANGVAVAVGVIRLVL